MKKSISCYTPVPPISPSKDSVVVEINDKPSQKNDSAKTGLSNSLGINVGERNDIVPTSNQPKVSTKGTTALENKLSVTKQPAAKENKSKVTKEPAAKENESKVTKEPAAKENEPKVTKEPAAKENEPKVTKEPAAKENESKVTKEPAAKENESKVTKEPAAKENESKVTKEPAAKENESKVTKEPAAKENESKVTKEPAAKENESKVTKEPAAKENESKVTKEPAAKENESKVTKEPAAKENESKVTKEPALSDERYMEKVLPELTTRMNHLNSLEDFICKEYLDELNFLQAVSKFGTFGQRLKAGDALTSLGVTELFQQIWKKYFDTDFLGKENKLMGDIMTGILIVMWNFTDKSCLLCERVYQIRLYDPILSYLGSSYLHPSKTKQFDFKRVVSGLMGILHNMLQKISESRESLREKKVVEIFQRFRDSPNEMIACKALILQGYVITEQENEIVNSDDTAFHFMKKILENALKYKDHYAKAYGFAAIEIISALNRLAVNDNNQMRIVNAGLLPLYVQLLQPECSVAEQAAAAEGLWTLEFKCKSKVENEPGCVEALQKLVNSSSDEIVVVQAKGALWMLQKDNINKQPFQQEPLSDGSLSEKDERHVFISYQWDSKPIIMKLVNSLKVAGYSVWVDFDKMSGSILEAMAQAVENAVVVIVCLTQKYKESPNCRTEGEYTFRLHKDTIPIRLQPRYQPDGWLGALIGNKYAFDFSNMDKYDSSFRGLLRELRERGRTGTDCPDGPVTVALSNTTSTQPPNSSCISSVGSWSTEEVVQWLQKNRLGHLQGWFHDIDGSLLIEYRVMRQNAPETFYGMLKENGFSLQDLLKLNKAMNQL